MSEPIGRRTFFKRAGLATLLAGLFSKFVPAKPAPLAQGPFSDPLAAVAAGPSWRSTTDFPFPLVRELLVTDEQKIKDILSLGMEESLFDDEDLL